ncbi:Caudovirales tail fiber assembly protein [compost metagenome]
MWYSASTNGPYDDPESYSDWPSDAVQISDKMYKACFINRPSNKIVVPDENGMPSLIDRPPQSASELAGIARVERDRQLRDIYDICVIMLQRELRLADPETSEALKAKLAVMDDYATKLLDVPQQAEFPSNITWPEIPTL